MQNSTFINRASLAILSIGFLALPSCAADNKEAPATQPQQEAAAPTTAPADSGVTLAAVKQGVAGGVFEDSFTTTATITAKDTATRQVTLTTADGKQATFICGPEIRNFDQAHVGDHVTATITERLVVLVRDDGKSPSVTHTAALATAAKGNKPGAMVSESYEIVATVKAIDTTNRIAALQFADDQTRTVHVRPDVDLSQYSVGDSVVIQVSSLLTVLVNKPQ